MLFAFQSTQNIGMPLPAQVYFLKIYLELMEGMVQVFTFKGASHFRTPIM